MIKNQGSLLSTLFAKVITAECLQWLLQITDSEDYSIKMRIREITENKLICNTTEDVSK